MSDWSQMMSRGRLVLIVGPSGVGKDTLIRLARDQCRNNQDVVFPTRTVTRDPSSYEDNRAVNSETFVRERTSGAFAFTWDAHGNSYGILRDIYQELAAGRTVVLNVSRTIVQDIRTEYPNVTVVQISAPPDVVRARLSARARDSDGDLAVRAARETKIVDCRPDIVIENTGAAEVGANMLLEAILNA